MFDNGIFDWNPWVTHSICVFKCFAQPFFGGHVSLILLGFLGLTPRPVTVANEGLVRDTLLKMVHNPGGDWHPWAGGTTQGIPN